MTAANATVCPKCGHVRTAEDAAPAWQCPACGIAYSKFRDASGRHPDDGRPGPGAVEDLRVRTLSVGQADKAGDIAIGVYLAWVSVFFVLTLAFPRLRAPMWVPALLAASAFLFWLGVYRRLRMVMDVPTSTIAAAAQGYVELQGRAAAAPGEALRGQLTGVPCIWYRYNWYTPGDDKAVDFGERGVPFILRDATGDCLVDSDDAEVICDRCQKWTEDGKVLQEWSIRVGDPVYAIGYLASGGADAERHVNLKVAYELAAQEHDRRSYQARYDVNRDGKVDRRETALAREARRRDVMEKFAGQGGVNALGPSPDGRPFLVIGAGQESITMRFRIRAVAHLCVFLAALGVGAYFWIRH
jgi:hypothetical protein